jgi:hypothetical protein
MLMYSVTTLEGMLLAAGLLATVTVLVLGVLIAFPRSMRVFAARVYCPLLGRRVGADLERDDWTLRFKQVVRCSVLGRAGAIPCTRACLSASVPPPVIRASRDPGTPAH